MSSSTLAGPAADLVVLGATPGGICAAITAARLGKTSILLERTKYIGGLPANGLGATDIATRGATGGVFLEFVRKIKDFYVGKYGANSPQAVDCDDGYHFEPSVAEKIFHQWLAEYPQVTVLTERQFDFEPDQVHQSDNTIHSIRVTNFVNGSSEIITGSFFLDCTYEGDLIAAAGVPFFLGREGYEDLREVGAGKLYKQWNGPECAGSTHAGDNAIQSYNYRLCLTNDPTRRVAPKKPENYNRNEYTSLIDDVKLGRHTGVNCPEMTKELVDESIKRAENNLPPEPSNPKLMGIGRLTNNVWLPNSKVDANNQHYAFLSTDLPEENWPYPTSSWYLRDKFAQRLREYTQGLLYFAQNDTELPAWFRENCQQWGWAVDEYADNDHFPRQLYVREGRRMKGKYIFTANDVVVTEFSHGKAMPGITEEAKKQKDGCGGWDSMSLGIESPYIHPSSITASHYALDSHAVRKREPGRAHLEGFFSYRCLPYNVPYEVIVPDSPIRNLLAPVPASASHVGFSTLRMEPCWMALGQAAGAAAVLCLESGCSSSDVDISKLQETLLDQEAILVYDGQLWETERDQTSRKELQLQWIKAAKEGEGSV